MRSTSDIRIREEVNALGIPPQEMLRAEIVRLGRMESYGGLLRTMAVCLVVAIAVALTITSAWVAVLQINGSSMNPLLQMDQVIIALRDDTPTRGDIIAFTHDNKPYVKRVIAMAGDRVGIDESGIVSINGEVLDEPYVSTLSLGNCDIEFPFEVPPGTVFVLGDNRPHSLDSRDSRLGTVRREQIVGKVRLSVWPFLRIGIVS